MSDIETGGDVATTAKPRTARMPSTGPFTTARGLLPLIVISLFLFALPIVMLVVGAFRNAAPGAPAQWSFEAFVRTYTDPASYTTLGNSVILAGSSTAIGVVVALVLAFLVTRTTTPLRRLVTPAMVLVVALPPLFYAISWGMLGNPTIGLINTVWKQLSGSGDALFDVNSWAGLILVVSLKNAAFAYLLIIGPFRALDRSLEEAAQVAGAGRLRTILGIDLVMLAPAITGVTILTFVIGLEAFDVPLFLGTPAGIDVFSTQIYSLIASRSPADYGGASAISLLLVVVVIALVLLQWRILGRRRFTTVGGKSYRTEPWNIGPWRWVGAVFIGIYLLVAIVAPLFQLVLGSLQPYFGAGTVYSLANYQKLLTNHTTVTALQSTFFVGLVGGLVAMVLALTLVYAITHNETRLRRLLDMLTWLPYAVPGVVLSLGLAWTYVSLPGFRQLYGSVFLVALALVVAVTPIATRAIQPAVIQINRELEEASRVSGAKPGRMVLGIVLPLIMPSFLSGWFVVAIVMSGNLAIPILLSSSTSPTVPLLVYQLYGQGQTSQAAALFVIMLVGLLFGLAVVAVIGRILSRRFGRTRTNR
ncbi:ABC transporter permease [Herbiconiux daphne]|uniref:Iron ABC transporter permease n=1 Tax=Herbiconiux daphne TaxID=2970914 RepID=A0ABT2H3K6_9MICO|nr:iron ABC transporter permease [Herbiconiux daphne]MCS5734515.1 iron ABC transporter permease [Herbiconiux daphne]